MQERHMVYKVFIDGQEGTTGLKLAERLAAREDIEILRIDEKLRKDTDERKRLIREADVAFLCLPDAAAKEAAELANGGDTIIIDSSTAHRTHPDWVYGLPELNHGQRGRVAQSKRISVPGCHATGFICLIAPLVAEGVIPNDAQLSCFSLTGYSGGGKKMIAQYEAEGREDEFSSPRPYALAQSHKHLPEMVYHTGLSVKPVFLPVVEDNFAGMLVTVPLHIDKTADELRQFYRRCYAGERFVTVADSPASGFLQMCGNVGTNELRISVEGGDGRITLSAMLDNLGKGSSGAAVQCMNIALGIDETKGLV
ncbi:MAG: N-acetyl-gamma-glutamyl-phosphate reductase [Oscillospiraceae bacterium]|nr:N-acetyl-gamma-glutamyl-phosphate reductase [Oscillospiraceae bacterium]